MQPGISSLSKEEEAKAFAARRVQGALLHLGKEDPLLDYAQVAKKFFA